MGKPQIPIEVNDDTGVWSVDGMPMILVPRHFLVNNHAAMEAALGARRYAEQLFDPGHKSAYDWCEKEARTHGLHGVDVFHHYMKRLSQRGWGQFRVETLDAENGSARIRIDHSVFVLEHKGGVPRKTCYMFAGWFAGALEFAGAKSGVTQELLAEETQCAADGALDHCVFRVRPAA